MRKLNIASLIVLAAVLSVMGCSEVPNDKASHYDKVNVYEMVSYAETKEHSLKVITDVSEIDILNEAVRSANKRQGIVNMIDPDYQIVWDDKAYFLWIREDSGTIMNVDETHIGYSLSKESAKEVYEVIAKYFQ